ncbi:MAG TPA: AbrB/MazE/SpoVT family DNA-binding domain-containing protein [Gemmatimonadaceae bacterium]|nr:AbrB/MazE/SpoVT family DNA-binding domain-containing protein [Gemmatimonadaceae bacterium]
MRVKETVIRPFGNSAGVTIPKEMLEKYDLDKGDRVSIQETAEGILVTPYDPDFADVMATARKVGKRYRNALRELSKR